MMAIKRSFFVILAVAVGGCLSKPENEVTVVGPPADNQVTVVAAPSDQTLIEIESPTTGKKVKMEVPTAEVEAINRTAARTAEAEAAGQLTYANPACKEPGDDVICMGSKKAEPLGEIAGYFMDFTTFKRINNLPPEATRRTLAVPNRLYIVTPPEQG